MRKIKFLLKKENNNKYDLNYNYENKEKMFIYNKLDMKNNIKYNFLKSKYIKPKRKIMEKKHNKISKLEKQSTDYTTNKKYNSLNITKNNNGFLDKKLQYDHWNLYKSNIINPRENKIYKFKFFKPNIRRRIKNNELLIHSYKSHLLNIKYK